MRVECQEIEQFFSDYLENSLEAGNLQLVQTHLNECPGCSQLLKEIKNTLALCEQFPELELPPRLIDEILVQTTGKISWMEYFKEFFRPLYTSPRFATGACLAAISLGIVLNSLGVDWSHLGHLRLADLTPRALVQNVEHTVNLAYDNGIRRINDLKILYEIQLKIDELRTQSGKKTAVAGKKTGAASEEKPEGSASSIECLTADNQAGLRWAAIVAGVTAPVDLRSRG
jgi:hypothetical protein